MNRNMKKLLAGLTAAAMYFGSGIQPMASVMMVRAEEAEEKGYSLEDAIEPVRTIGGLEGFEETIFAPTELAWKESQEVLEDGQHVRLSVSIAAEEDESIISLRKPDGTVEKGATASYDAPCNGIYEFEAVYEKDGEERTERYYVIVFESSRMEDGNRPSKANGFMPVEGSVSPLMNEGMPTGDPQYKLMQDNVTVDGETFGRGYRHYIAYITMWNEEAGRNDYVMCLDPHKTLSDSITDYDGRLIEYGQNEWIEGKGDTQIESNDLALIWYYCTQYGELYGNAEGGFSFSAYDWYFLCQLMIWDKLGYSVDWGSTDSEYARARDWAENLIGDHEEMMSPDADKMMEVWENAPWGDNIETVYGTGGTCEQQGTQMRCTGGYLSMDGKVNEAEGQWVRFDPKTTVHSFGDPKNVSGKFNVTFKDVENEPGNPANGTHKEIDAIEGGSIWIRHCDEKRMDKYSFSYERKSRNIDIRTKGKSEGFNSYEFVRTGHLQDVETVPLVWGNDWVQGNSAYFRSSLHEQEGAPQPIMNFRLGFNDNIPLMFSEQPNAEVPDVQEKPQPKELEAPSLEKRDSEDKFPVEGAEFTFHAGETYKLHYVWTKEVEVWRCTGSGDDEVCGWEDGGTSEGKKLETVWSQGDEVMDSETTPSDGRIDTSPIIQNYYDEYDALWTEIQEEYAEKSTNESSDTRNVTYTVELDPEYLDKEGTGWIGGRFYAQEPHTSQNTCNSDPLGNGICNPDFNGYLNLHKWEKIAFEIKEKTGTGNAEPLVIYHDNDRQKGRFTVHKVDGEDEYLNHNNSHEAQGDGYFYGSVFVVTAREDIVLHDGSIPNSDFTGNPLNKGEVADVLVLQLPKKDDGTYDYEYLDNLSTSTTMMLELGKYAVQEVRWPGVYKEDLPLVYDRNDGLWHVDPAQADDVLAKLKDKDSDYYRFDYEKATALYENGILPINSPDGGYWFKDYVNGIANTTNAGFIGGQTVDVDIKYVGEDSAYNEVVPHGTLDELGGTLVIQGEEVSHTLPTNYASPDVEDTVAVTVAPDLDYANSIQKGHIQLKKILTEAPGIDGNNDNTGVDPDLNIAGKDIYFAVYLDRKTGSLIQDSIKDYELVDKYFASERLDGLKYVYDANGNFDLYAEDDPTSNVTGYHKASEEEIQNGLGLVMVSVDGTTADMKPADNYYKWEMREMSDYITASIKVNTYVNPYYNNIALNDQNLSDKELYMILKTDAQGLAGTNMPHTIVWANYAALDNTGNANNYGEWSYNTGSLYSKEHAEVLDYLHKNGLPLPYGSYTIVELNAPQGYEGVSWKAQVSKNLTTYDINEETTVWELGIEKSTEKYLSGNQNPQGWASQQASVDGDGHAEDQTWLNKQFHIFSDYVSTSRYVGENIEDKLHRQILEIVKVDKETGKTIAYDSASFKLFQWNPTLDLNDSWKHAEYADGEWKVTYEVPEYDDEGNIVSVATYQGTDWYTDSKGISAQLGQWIVVPAGSTGIYTTDDEGRTALSQPLPPADYFLLEVKAPEGYLLHDQPIPFSIEAIGGTTEPNEGDYAEVPLFDEAGNFVCKTGKDCNDPASPDYALDSEGNARPENVETEKVPSFVTIAVTAEDMPQKGYVEIEKKGSIFDRFVQYVTDFAEMIGFKPTWKEDQTVKLNTTFCIYAREDIVVNGEVKFAKDECIQKMDTDDEGHAYSEELYLGKYYVKECDAPHGYITSGEEMDFELAYDDQKVIVHPDFKEFQNDRQKFSIHLNKSDEEGNPLEGAVFGIFAGEDLPKGIQHEEEPEKTGNETLSMDEMDVSLNGKWQNVCKETESGIVCDSTFVGEKTAVLNAVSTDKERFSVPDKVTIDGEEVPLVTIGAYAFMNCDAKAITLPETITTVKDYAFAMNDKLEYLQFLGKDAPSFISNVFPTGHELLGIYIPWNALSSYDLANVDGVADNNGSKDQRLMGIPLKDGNLLWNEDEGFNQNPFDTEGFLSFGKAKDTEIPYDEAMIDFELEYKTKTITLKNGNTAEIEGYFITGYKGTESTITVPEILFNSPEGYEQRIVGIDAGAFKGIEAKTILVPDTIRYIGNEAFSENQNLSMIRFYETEYREFEDESGNGSLDVDDGIQIDPEAEICSTSGGTWKDTGSGTYACAYSHEAQKTTSEEECTALGGTYADGVCTYQKESFGEMPEPDLDAGMSVAEMIVGRRLLLVGIGEAADVATPSDTDKSNSQIACEANGGTWNETLGTCSGGETEVEETLDGGFDIGYRPSNSQTACEAKGGEWNDILGTCSLEYEPDWDETPVYVSESAFDFTPSLTWIVAGEFNWYRFDTAYIVDSNGDVLVQDGDRDGSLWWNPEALNPQTGKQGYWELGEDKPALLGYPIVLNHLTDDEDPIDPGMSFPNEELPNETTGIKEGTLIEVVRTDAEGRAVTQFDYPEGKYYVRELKAPEGYEISREAYPIELVYQENDEPTIDVYANNGNPIINKKAEKHPLRIDIYKVDEDTLKGLAGAEFQLWNYERTTVLETLITDSTGHAVTKGLYDIDANDGHYWLKETKAPDGYEIIGDGWTEVTIDEDSSSSTTLIVVKNRPENPEEPPVTPGGGSSQRRIKIELIKSLEKDRLFGDAEAWKDVEFGIFAAEDIYGGTKRNPKLIYEADEMIFSSGIDENGIFNIVWKDSDYDIENGKYYVQEIRTSKDYVLNDHKYYFDVDEDRNGSLQIVEINDLKPIVNELKRTLIKVMKIDRYTKESLPDAKMGIYATYEDARNDTNALEYAVADDEGNAYFYNYPNGTYYIKEVDAPFGYQVSDEIVTAEITGNHEDNTYVIVYTNVLLPGGGGNNPPTGDDRNPLLVAVFGFLSASMAFFCLKKKKNEKI